MKSSSRIGSRTIQGGKMIASRFSQTAPLAAKTSNRAAAVHGSKDPITHTLDNREKVVKEINEGKDEKGKKWKEVEQTADSQLNHPQKPSSVTDSPGYTASS